MPIQHHLQRFLPRVIAGAVVLVAVASCSSSTTPKAASSSGTTETPRRDSVACKTDDVTLPIQAFDINTDAASGNTCDIGNVLDEDGAASTLNWSGNGTHQIAGHDVTGCIAAEFSDGVALNGLRMKMQPVGSACGHTCTNGGDDGCGTGWKVDIFAGPSIDELDWLQQLSLTTKDLFEYRVVVYARFKAKFVAICREPTPATGDDISIDSISGTCE